MFLIDIKHEIYFNFNTCEFTSLASNIFDSSISKFPRKTIFKGNEYDNTTTPINYQTLFSSVIARRRYCIFDSHEIYGNTTFCSIYFLFFRAYPITKIFNIDWDKIVREYKNDTSKFFCHVIFSQYRNYVYKICNLQILWELVRCKHLIVVHLRHGKYNPSIAFNILLPLTGFQVFFLKRLWFRLFCLIIKFAKITLHAIN